MPLASRQNADPTPASCAEPARISVTRQQPSIAARASVALVELFVCPGAVVVVVDSAAAPPQPLASAATTRKHFAPGLRLEIVTGAH